MKKNIYKLLICLLGVLTFASCEKDNISNSFIDDNPDRMTSVAKDLKKTMASSANGWVMMVKTTLSQDVYTPIVLKFDTVTNRVDIRTVYGPTDANKEDYFRITNSTGAPQLIFTTGSIMSSLYRVGAQASDITDHMYNVVKVTAEEIHIQPYRSGKVYAPEGGVVYKLFKRPVDWKWAEDAKYFDFTNASFTTDILGAAGSMKFEYVNDPSKNKTFTTTFGTVAAANLATTRNGFPFAISRNIGTGGFGVTDYTTLTYPIGTTNTSGWPIVANNGLSFYPGVAGYTANVTNLRNFCTTYGFHYLMAKSVTRIANNVKIEFEAYDKDGKVIVKAFYDNLK